MEYRIFFWEILLYKDKINAFNAFFVFINITIITNNNATEIKQSFKMFRTILLYYSIIK